MSHRKRNTIHVYLCKVPRSSQNHRHKVEWWQPEAGGKGGKELLFNRDRV